MIVDVSIKNWKHRNFMKSIVVNRTKKLNERTKTKLSFNRIKNNNDFKRSFYQPKWSLFPFMDILPCILNLKNYKFCFRGGTYIF